MNKRQVFLNVISSIILGLVSAGFVAGLVVCSDCTRNLLSETLGRLFIGVVFAVYNLFTLGYPPLDGSGDRYVDLRLWSLLAAIVIFLVMNRKKIKWLNK